jgi:type II secretory pathway component PulF
VPVFGRFLRAVAAARFTRTLANALAGNVPVGEAVALAGLASGNAAVDAASARVVALVREGRQISEGLAEAGRTFPATVVWMLHIAEQRGEVGEALRECARLEEARAERMSGSIAILVGGVTFAFATFVLAEGAVAMLLPLVSFMQSVGT